MHYPKKINCSLFGCMTFYWYTYSSFNQYRESTLVSCTMNVCTKTTVERNCIRNRKIIFASGHWVLFVLFGLDEKWPDRPEPKQPQKCAIPTQKIASVLPFNEPKRTRTFSRRDGPVKFKIFTYVYERMTSEFVNQFLNRCILAIT